MGTSTGWTHRWPSGVPSSLLATVVAERSGTRLTVRKELAVLVDHCIDETERRGYLLDQSQTGAYVNRAIGGTSTASNHSRGTAVDLNWRENPFTSNPLAKFSMPRWVPNEIWKPLGFSWGGDWSGKKDFMHIEFLGTPAQAAAWTATISQGATDDMSQAEVAQIIAHIDAAARNLPEQFLGASVTYPVPINGGDDVPVPVFDLLRYTDVRVAETLVRVKALEETIATLAQAQGVDVKALLAGVEETVTKAIIESNNVHAAE